MVPRALQVREATLPPVLPKDRRISPCRSQSQGDLTSEGVGSQACSRSITRSRAKALTYVEVTLQSSITTLNQGREQPEEQHKFVRSVFYDLETLFHEEELSAFVPQGQISQDDQADNMLVLATSSPSLEEPMQEL